MDKQDIVKKDASNEIKSEADIMQMQNDLSNVLESKMNEIIADYNIRLLRTEELQELTSIRPKLWGTYYTLFTLNGLKDNSEERLSEIKKVIENVKIVQNILSDSRFQTEIKKLYTRLDNLKTRCLVEELDKNIIITNISKINGTLSTLLTKEEGKKKMEELKNNLSNLLSYKMNQIIPDYHNQIQLFNLQELSKRHRLTIIQDQLLKTYNILSCLNGFPTVGFQHSIERSSYIEQIIINLQTLEESLPNDEFQKISETIYRNFSNIIKSQFSPEQINDKLLICSEIYQIFSSLQNIGAKESEEIRFLNNIKSKLEKLSRQSFTDDWVSFSKDMITEYKNMNNKIDTQDLKESLIAIDQKLEDYFTKIGSNNITHTIVTTNSLEKGIS